MAEKLIITSNPSAGISDDLWPRRLVLELDFEQSIENNTTTVNYVLKVDGTHEGAYSYLTLNVIYIAWGRRSLYGTGDRYKNYHYLYTPGEQPDSLQVESQEIVQTGSFTVEHLIDGSFPYTFYTDMTGYITNQPVDDMTVSGLVESKIAWGDLFGDEAETFIPTVIPRASTVTCTTVEVGRNPTISINSPSTSFTHTLRYQFGSLTGTIATGVKGGNYNNWSIPTSFLGEIAEDKFGEGTIYCDTYSNGSFNGTESCTFRVNVPSLYGPTLAPTAKDINATTLALTGDENKIIQFFNKVQYDIGAFTSTGATIKSCEISCGGKSATTMTGVLENVESGSFTVSATDSRDFTTTETFNMTLVPYVKLTAKLQLVSLDTDGTGKISISGNLFRGSFGVVDNEPVISYRHKVEGGTWSDWKSVTYSITNDSYHVDIELNGMDYQETYIYQARAVDSLMNVETGELVVRCMPVFDWSGEDFQFNVPVTINGNVTVTGTITSANPVEQVDDEPGITPADYIVEQGTVTTGSGNSTANWAYRKWNSGVAECWCRKYISTAVTSAWGNLFVSGAMPHTNITWGVDFIDIPVANITIAPNASGAFLIAGGSTSLTATNTGGYEIARGSALTSAGNFYINYYGIGKWK